MENITHIDPKSSSNFQLPPGFRFHPSDEELIIHYLKNKVTSSPLPASIIADIDLYKYNPWELPTKSLFGEDEWYFFTPRDRKYPNGARPNRAAASGYWKATGTDKPILNSSGTASIGVKKALVFYKGCLPKGIKTDWFMHEYRLINDSVNVINWNPKRNGSMRLDDWVLCRVRQKSKDQRSTWEDQSTLAPAPKGGCNNPKSSGSELQHPNPDPNLEMVNNYLYNECPMLPYLIASQDFPFSYETPASTMSFQSTSTERSSPTTAYKGINPLENSFNPAKRKLVEFGNSQARVLPSIRFVGSVEFAADAGFCATDQSVDSNFSAIQWNNNTDTIMQYQDFNQIAFEIDN